jgi:Right handed beta helix region
MKSLRFSLNLLVVLLFVLAFSSIASAQASRTWVSGVGDDVNPCSRTAPCKTFAGAISKTAPGGEIDCLDPGGFGAVTITKAITIDCDPGTGGASILVSGGNGIVIAANAATDVINLLNLGLNGLNLSTSGIKVNSALTVHLEDVTVYGFTTACVEVAGSANSQLTIENSQLMNCGTAGIKTNTSVGTVVGDFHNVRIFNSGNGINAQNGSRLVVRDSVISLANPGVNQSGLTGNGSTVLVEGSTLSNSGTAAMQSIGGASMTACGNTFAGNALIFNTNGGQIFSCGDNKHLTTDPLGSAPGSAPVI